MKKEKLNPVVIATNIICAVLLLAMVAVLFLPTWTLEGETFSLASYIGFPSEKSDLLKNFNDTLELGLKRTEIPSLINEVITVPVCVILLAAVGILTAILSQKTPVSAMVTLLTGALGLIGYGTNPFIALGSSYTTLLIVSGVAAAAGLVGVILFVISLLKKKKVAI